MFLLLCKVVNSSEEPIRLAEESKVQLFACSYRQRNMSTQSSRAKSSAMPGSSRANSSAIPGSSRAKSSATPSTSQAESSATPSTSRAKNSAVPGSSQTKNLAVPGSSQTKNSAMPGSSQTKSSATPSTSRAKNSAVPGSSQTKSSATPSTSRAKHSAVPGSSQAQSSAIPSTSRAKNSAVPGSSQAKSYATPSTSQATITSTQSSSKSRELSAEDLQRLTNDTVTYILSQDYKKHTVKRADIVSHVMINHGRSFIRVMEQVKNVFDDVYGLKLVDIDKRQYFLVNKTLLPRGTLQIPEEVRPQQVLLLVVLSYMFMKGSTVRDDHLYQYLEHLEIVKPNTSEPHKYFGDVRKLLTREFVHMHYLTYQRRPDTIPTVCDFSMGERAIEEIPKRKLLEFVCKINRCSPTDYPMQLNEVLEQEKTLHTELSEGN